MSDHKAEALRLAQIADNTYGCIEHRNGADAVSQGVEALMIAVEAQVHATLYLAEQQKRTANEAHLANLIAFLESEGGPYKVINNVEGGWSSAIEQIREGLGLS